MTIYIIGGGVAGLTTAWRLAAAGQAVVVHTTPGGASPLALGGLVPFGNHVRGRIAAVQRAGVAAWHALAPELAATTHTPLASFYRTWALPDDQTAAQLHVPQVLALLTQAIQHHGGVVQVGAPVADFSALQPTPSAIILAAGWGTRAWWPHAAQTWRLDYAQAIRLAPPAGYAPHFIYADKLYVLPDFDGSVVVGSLSVPGPNVCPHTTAKLYATACHLAPTLAGSTIVHTWVGARPTPGAGGKLPLVQLVHYNVWAVGALGRIGYALAPMVAAEVATALGLAKPK